MSELRRNGHATQLYVAGEPFLVLGGELGNSVASDARALDALWPGLVELGLNTVLVPVSWELIEPEEGHLEFSRVDELLRGARAHDLRLVLLWFGCFKNSLSSYAPFWVKADQVRFPRARLESGRALEMVSPFSKSGLEADARAFSALMQHLTRRDREAETVIMVQVENEVGMLADARDFSDEACAAFAEPVPEALLDHLRAHRGSLALELANAWAGAGGREAGTWTEVFGEGREADEIFMAWHYARYLDHLAAAGKRQRAMVMFANAALNRPGTVPGEYPSAGPLPHLRDVWRAGAPSIDLLAPDLYLPGFASWCERYCWPNNPLFIPEAGRDIAFDVDALYAFGRHAALGYSPFAIDTLDESDRATIRACYGLLRCLAPRVIAGQAEGATGAVLLDHDQPRAELELGGYRFTCVHDYTWEWSGMAGTDPPWPRAGALVIALGPDEFYVAGRGVIITFQCADDAGAQAGIGFVDEGSLEGDRWVPRRRLNGDETHQGRHLRIPADRLGLQRVRLYRYR